MDTQNHLLFYRDIRILSCFVIRAFLTVAGIDINIKYDNRVRIPIVQQ